MSSIVYPVGVDLTKIDATTDIPSFKPGERVKANGEDWMFVKVATSATLAQYNVVMIDPTDFTAKPILGGAASEAMRKIVGFYQNSTSATAAQYCWVMLQGSPNISVLGSCAKNVQLFTTDTSGALDDAIATGSQYPIRGVALVSVNGSTASTGPAGAWNPSVGPLTALN